MSSKYRIGKIARCFGIRGEVIVNPETYDLNRYDDLREILVGSSEFKTRRFKVNNVRMHKGRPVISFDGVTTRNEAEELTGHSLYVNEEDRIELPEGTHFLHDLIGMTVTDDKENVIGTVREVLLLPAHPVYVVKENDKEFLIPAVGKFIKNIDKENRIIQIEPIEGLLE